MDVLGGVDEGLAGAVHGVFPAGEAAEVIPCFRAPGAEGVAGALSPDGALDVGGLELAVNAEEGAGGVDVELGVEEGVAVGDALGDAEGDGDGGGAAGGLEGEEVGGVGGDDEGLFGVAG